MTDKVNYMYSEDEEKHIRSMLDDLSFIPQTFGNVKVPHFEWRKRVFSKEEIEKSLPTPVSIIPGNFLLAVVDIDNDVEEVAKNLRLLYPPDSELISRKGLHFYYKISKEFATKHSNNYKLTVGDWRCKNGVLVIWHPTAQFVSLMSCLKDVPVKDRMLDKLLSVYRKKSGNHQKTKGPLAVVSSVVEENRDVIVRGQGTAHSELLRRLTSACFQADEEDIKKQISIARAANIPQTEIDKAIEWAKENIESKVLKGLKNSYMLEEAFKVIGLECIFCPRLQIPFFKAVDSDDWERFTNNNCSLIREKIQTECFTLIKRKDKFQTVPLWFNNTEWEQCFSAFQERKPYDRLLNWLEQLPPVPAPLITPENWLSELFGCGDDAYCRYAQSAILYGIVLRARFPGAMIKTHTVLVGATGIGKSPLVNFLLPPSLKDFALEGMDMSKVDLQEFSYLLKGKAIIELSEMRGASKVEAAAIKTLLNLRTLEVRPKYGKLTEIISMSNVFVGTANNITFLPSEEIASLRFMPLKCEFGNNVEKFLAEHRESLFSQACDIVTDEHILSMIPKEIRDQHANINKNYQAHDPVLLQYYDSLVDSVLDKKRRGDLDWRGGYNHANISMMSWGVQDAPKYLLTFHNLLLESGWTSQQPNKKKSKVWYAPEDLIDDLLV